MVNGFTFRGIITRYFFFWKYDTYPFCEYPDSLWKTERFHSGYKTEYISTFPTPKTLKNPHPWVHIERGRLFVVERAQSYEI